MRRPALAKPTRSLRWSMEVEPNWLEMMSSAACRSRSMSSPISSSICFLTSGTTTSSRYSGVSWDLTCSTTERISDSVTQEPWIRTGVEAPGPR